MSNSSRQPNVFTDYEYVNDHCELVTMNTKLNKTVPILDDLSTVEGRHINK